jgi:hypothetical protein
MSPLVSSSPEQTSKRTPPSLDPDSWEATKQVEEFNRRIRDFEIEFTETAKNYSYPSKDNEIADEERHIWLGKPRTSFPNRYSFAYTAYQSAKVSGAPLQVIFDKVHEVWTYIQQAYAGGLIKPGSAPLSKIEQLRLENEKLKGQVDELTKQLAQKDYIINHLGGRQEGEINPP